MTDEIDSEESPLLRQQVWNCAPRLKFECPRQWESLTPTSQQNVRHCSSCDADVFLCQGPDEFLQRAKKKQCVAIPKIRTIGFAQEWTRPMLGRPDPEKVEEAQLSVAFWRALAQAPKPFISSAVRLASRTLDFENALPFRLPVQSRDRYWTRETVIDSKPPFDLNDGWRVCNPDMHYWSGLVMSSQYAFNTFGLIGEDLLKRMGCDSREVLDAMAWAHNDCEAPTLLRVVATNRAFPIAAIVFAPGENARCYKRFVRSRYSRPSRDFFYNVTYEALAALGSLIPPRDDAVPLGSETTFGLSELAGGSPFHPDIFKAQTEALYHYAVDANNPWIDRLWFFAGQSGMVPESIFNVLPTLKGTVHRPAKAVLGRHGNFDTIEVSW